MSARTAELPKSVPLDSIKLSPEVLDSLLDEMDRQAKLLGTSRRRHKRFNCRCAGLVVTADQNGFRSTFAVPVRNISGGGIAFLHRAMIHVGSGCQVQIRTPAHRWIQTTGKVVRSRYVKTGIYEIGLEFDGEIDVEPFTNTTT